MSFSTSFEIKEACLQGCSTQAAECTICFSLFDDSNERQPVRIKCNGCEKMGRKPYPLCKVTSIHIILPTYI